MTTELKHSRPLNMPINRVGFEDAAEILNISVKELRKILWMIKFGKKDKWQKDVKNQETIDNIATYRIEKSIRVSGGLALFVKTNGAALLNGVSALIEFELQLLGTTGRWTWGSKICDCCGDDIEDPDENGICNSCFNEVQSVCK